MNEKTLNKALHWTRERFEEDTELEAVQEDDDAVYDRFRVDIDNNWPMPEENAIAVACEMKDTYADLRHAQFCQALTHFFFG